MRRGAFAAGLVALLIAFPAAAAGSAWTVDKSKSTLGFRSQASGVPFTGRFKSWDAQIDFDPADLSRARVVATVDVGSVDTANEDRDELLPTSSFFDTAKFPRATFIASRFVAKGGNRYEAAGDLTIKGITKPLTLPFTLVISGNTAQMTGQIALNRSAFAIGTGQWASDETIDRTVTVTVNLTATRR